MSKQYITTSSSFRTRRRPFQQAHFPVEMLRHGFPRVAWNAATHRHPARAYATEPGLTTCALQAVMYQIESQITGRLKQRLGE